MFLLSYLSAVRSFMCCQPQTSLWLSLPAPFITEHNHVVACHLENNAMYFCVSLDWWSQPSVGAILRKRPKCCGQHAPLPPLCMGWLETNVLKTQQSFEAFIHCNQPLWNVCIETLHASHNIDLQQKHWQMNYEKVLTAQKIFSSSCFPRKKRGTARGTPPPIK